MQKTLLALILPLLLVGCKQNVSEQEISSEDRLAISKYEMSDKGKDKLNTEDLAEKEFCESQWVKDKFASNDSNEEYRYGYNMKDRYGYKKGYKKCLLLSPEKNIAVVVVDKFKKDEDEDGPYKYLDVAIYLIDTKKKKVLDQYYDKRMIEDAMPISIIFYGIEKVKNFESAFIVGASTTLIAKDIAPSDKKSEIYMYTPDFKIKKLVKNLRTFSDIEQSYYREEEPENKCVGASYELKADIQALNSQSNGLPDIQVTYAEKAKEYVTVNKASSDEDEACQWQTADNYPNDTIVLKFDGKQYLIPNQPKYKYDEAFDDFKFYWDYVMKHENFM